MNLSRITDKSVNQWSLTPLISTRQAQYRSLFAAQIDEMSLTQVREATNKAWVLGSEHFKQKIADQINRRTDKLAKGGDRKSDEFKQNNR